MKLAGLLTLASLCVVLAFSARAISRAHPSRLVLIRTYEGSERAILAQLNQAATRAGLDCRPTPEQTWDGHPDPNPGIQCYFPREGAGFRGNIRAVGYPDKQVVLISILSSNLSTPTGEIDPVIEQTLTDFRDRIGGDDAIASIQECWAPDLGRCSTD